MRPIPSLALAAVTISLTVAPPAFAFTAPAEPTKPVEVSRFLGRWYEVARVPNQFERGADCAAPTADYLQTNSRITVVQTCHRGSPSGPEKVYRPSAQIVDTATNAKFRLTYFLVLSKDYWILDHGADYKWAIIGDPTGKFVWGLSRSQGSSAAERAELTAHIKALGYDTGRLEFPQQG